MQSVTLNVDDEMKAAGDAIAMIIADVKSGKGAAAIATDALPLLISAVSGYSNMGKDILKVDNQVYLVRAIAMGLEPAPAA